MSAVFAKRFDELAAQLNGVIESRHAKTAKGKETIDYDKLLQWKVKAENLLVKACGSGSVHLREFECGWGMHTTRENHLDALKRIGAVFLAAKEDCEGGYLRSAKSLIQADLFGSELDQARYLLGEGYISAAAVIAGVVLETTLRELCGGVGILPCKADRMNAELAKAGVYNSLRQKQVTALLAVRNAAAHGKTKEFTENDVKTMIPDVEKFIADHL